MSHELTLLTVSFLQQSPFKFPLNNLDNPPPLPTTPPPNSLPPKLKHAKSTNGNDNCDTDGQSPPPLPKRNRPDARNKSEPPNGKVPSLNANSNFINEEINSNQLESSPGEIRDRCYSLGRKPRNSIMVDNSLYSDLNFPPPPLPPRAPVSNPGSSESDAANSINKQMSYPLVATCATLVNNYVSNIVVLVFLCC